MRAYRGTEMPVRDGKRLAKMILRFTNFQLSRPTKGGTDFPLQHRVHNLGSINCSYLAAAFAKLMPETGIILLSGAKVELGIAIAYTAHV